MAWSSSANDREYLFIDGGCLRSSVRKISNDLFGDGDAYHPLVSALGNGFDKVFYYDAVSGKEHGEAQAVYEARVQPEHERFAEIQALDRVHVALGNIVGQDRRQKGVDVRLAVDMMTHAFRGNITKATLFAGDADFVPLLKALVAEGLHVTLWHPPQANAELKGAADTTRRFEFKQNHKCFTRDGEHSAFSLGGAGSGVGMTPERDGIKGVIADHESKYAASWIDETLKVYQASLNYQNWTWVTLRAPGSTLSTALRAFDAIQSWGVSARGEAWIHIP